MNRYKTLFFDLDGTLTDPGLGITNSVAYALRCYGIEPPEREALYPFIGPPLVDSFQRFYHFPEEQAHEAVERYRDYFRDRGIYENTVYPGIPELLQDLRASGHTLALATSKPEPFAIQILEHFSLLQFFDTVAGARMDETRTAKADVIALARKRCALPAPDTILMIGDREYDILGAKAQGICAVGVLYGYGSREELEKAGADSLAASVQELRSLLLS